MTLRLIATCESQDTGKTAKVYRNPAFNEYQVKLFIDGKYYEPADYFTDDKEDSLDTARHMVDQVSRP